mgnify:CR=1 FL=1
MIYLACTLVNGTMSGRKKSKNTTLSVNLSVKNTIIEYKLHISFFLNY